MTATARRPYASAAEALSFPFNGTKDYAVVRNRLDTDNGCECEPYRDILTAGRWRALDYHIRKGEHACAHGGKSKVIPLFCRCQVEPSQYLANLLRIQEIEAQLQALQYGDEIPF